ncbi:Glycine cleavage system H protein [Penicillium frequentans]|uniref:Glycine cleavage system H protein n=1 Tax=Penicillium frequentans TaxID=3151616 RepID=A0AAD6D431_9EURO|nr:Glycine cleavage system H protein [Penicillium glabrum]
MRIPLSVHHHLRRGSTYSFPFLNSPLLPLHFFFFSNPPSTTSKMASVARAFRPLTSRALAQKPLASSCRATPAFRFPRGTRSFSQSPLAQVKKYTESHEWIELVDGTNTAKIGITKYAANSLGDVVFVELPEADLEVSAGEPVGAVESVKSASDVLSPVAGKVIQGNAVLEDNAKTINSSPEQDGWIAEIEVSDAAELGTLLSEEAYLETLEGDH